IPEMAGATEDQHKLLAASKRQIVGLLESLQERIIASRLLQPKELVELVKQLAEPFPGEFFTTSGMNCWGRKPTASEV
ncbi:MAG: hypothetical protein KC561_08395, partial [Myxococcales bacterium]|nr:hypothetical protein [Myxococcales bacterium]